MAEIISKCHNNLGVKFKATVKSREKNANGREKILSLLRLHPEYSAKKLAAEIGITPKAIEKQLAKLKSEGRIKRNGPDKGGSWEVK